MSDRRARTPVRVARSPVDVPIAVLVWFLAWFGGQVLFQAVAATAGGVPDDETLPISTLGPAITATWCAYLAGLWWASGRAGTGSFRADYRLSFRAVDLVGVPIGVLTQLVLLPVLYLPLRELAPGTFSEDRLEETAQELAGDARGATLVALVVLLVIGAPIVEELVYRGLLQSSFASRVSDWLALVAGSVWFALIHFRPVEIPGLLVAGLVFGACLVVTRRLGMSIAAHAGFNATGLVSVLDVTFPWQ